MNLLQTELNLRRTDVQGLPAWTSLIGFSVYKVIIDPRHTKTRNNFHTRLHHALYRFCRSTWLFYPNFAQIIFK